MLAPEICCSVRDFLLTLNQLQTCVSSFENVIDMIIKENSNMHVTMNTEFGFQTKFLTI